MSTISADQRFALLSALAANGNWEGITTEQVQLGIREAHNFAGQEFTAFIRNGFRMQIGDFRYTEDITIEMPAMKRPTLEELCAREPLWIRAENGIERDTSTEEPVILRLGTVLRLDEAQIDAAEYERRMVNVPSLGLQHSDYIIQHQDDNTPAFAALRALQGKIYIDFRGLVVVNKNAIRSYPCVHGKGKRFVQSWDRTREDLFRSGRIAVPCK